MTIDEYIRHGAAILGVLSALPIVGLTYMYLSSPPRPGDVGSIARLRRIVVARQGARALCCRVHSDRLASVDGYCSAECMERDATMQAIR